MVEHDAGEGLPLTGEEVSRQGLAGALKRYQDAPSLAHDDDPTTILVSFTEVLWWVYAIAEDRWPVGATPPPLVQALKGARHTMVHKLVMPAAPRRGWTSPFTSPWVSEQLHLVWRSDVADIPFRYPNQRERFGSMLAGRRVDDALTEALDLLDAGDFWSA